MWIGRYIPYSRKIWRGIKFGGLAVQSYNRQIKIRQNFLLAYIRMAIPYRTAKFKSANILIIAILGSTANFNSRQYFRLYGIYTPVEFSTRTSVTLSALKSAKAAILPTMLLNPTSRVTEENRSARSSCREPRNCHVTTRTCRILSAHMNVTTIARLLILLKAHAHTFVCFIPRVSWAGKESITGGHNRTFLRI